MLKGFPYMLDVLQYFPRENSWKGQIREMTSLCTVSKSVEYYY